MDVDSSVTGCTSGSLSDDGTPVTATPPSTEPPIITQGELPSQPVTAPKVRAQPLRTRLESCAVLSSDAVDASLLSELSADLLGLDVESWSLAVSPEFCRLHDRRTVKRQDVIYGETLCFMLVFLAQLLIVEPRNCSQAPGLDLNEFKSSSADTHALTAKLEAHKADSSHQCPCSEGLV